METSRAATGMLDVLVTSAAYLINNIFWFTVPV